MRKRVVITGLGCISAAGAGKEEFWKNVIAGRSHFSSITQFDSTHFPIKLAAQINNVNFMRYVSPRIKQQTDRHTQLGLVASHFTLEDSKLDLEVVDLERVGTIIGNNLGGSAFGEEQLTLMHSEGANSVSAFQSIAWFYAATIGQVSIKYGFKGYSKTYTCDRISSHSAMGDAFRVIQRGELDVCLVGGCEAPLSPYAIAGYMKSNLLSFTENVEDYKPFDVKRNGLIVGEGGAMLLFEELEHALKRNAKIYAEIVGFAQTCDAIHHHYPNPDGMVYSKSIENALLDSGVRTEEIGCIFVDGCGGKTEDIREFQAIKNLFGDKLNTISVVCPKTIFGHTYGAAGAFDMVVSCLSLKDNLVPPVANTTCVDQECSLPLVLGSPLELRKTNVLVLGTGIGGLNVALIVASPNFINGGIIGD